MDSVSQLALGASIGVAVMGNKTAIWKAALVGAVCGTLPDLDILIRNSDEIKNMTTHRAQSHSLLYLTLLLTPLIAWCAVNIFHQHKHWRSWTLAIWLALITHPLLDVMTIYGTQMGIPFTNYPFAIGSIFIIDPAYTLWLLLGLILALSLRNRYGLIANTIGLILSTIYLGWSLLAQQIVLREAQQAIAMQYDASDKVIATPTPFNTLVWRIVAMPPHGYLEGYYSLLKSEQPIQFNFYPTDSFLYEKVQHNWHVQRMNWFTQGIFFVKEQNGQLIITDLRMGAGPCYTFQFNVGQIEDIAQAEEGINNIQQNAKSLPQDPACINYMLKSWNQKL